MTTPAFAVNRMCGSGFQSAISGAQEIVSGASGIVLTGGAEHMTEAPFVLRDARFGTRLGADLKVCSISQLLFVGLSCFLVHAFIFQLDDVIWSTLFDRHIQMGMGITAENIAERYGISREQCDEYALLSQTRWHEGEFFFINMISNSNDNNNRLSIL